VGQQLTTGQRRSVLDTREHNGASAAGAGVGPRASKKKLGPRRQCKNNWRVAIAISLALLAASACSAPAPETKNYAAKLAAERTAKDAMLGNDVVPNARHAEFLPLSYFPIDPEYDVPAQLKPSEDRTVFEMPTSAGTPRMMRRVGTLQFTLKGQPLKLTAFVEADAKTLDRLFVPFNDLTSGTETYPGGRYMDLDRTATGIYEIDFNRAYHPYCYYNPTYECPIPPSENRLKIPVRAGERLRKQT
jgi:hypothetical protein